MAGGQGNGVIRVGSWQVGFCVAFVYLPGVFFLVQDQRTGDALASSAGLMVVLAVISSALCTWLSMLPRLHKGPSE